MTRKQLAGRSAVLLVVLFLAAFLSVSVAGLWDDARRSDVGIVLGNAVESDGQPSDRLRARLDKAVELYRAGMFGDVIVSGGRDNQGFNEADVMQRYMIEQGVPEDRVYVDKDGIDTYATAHDAKALMETHGWRSALVVSQYFHLPRCRLALRRWGVTQVSAAHASYFELRDLYATCREVAAYAFYLVRSYG